MAVPVTKVISGGQTGADRGALRAARHLGLPTGGWIPFGFRTDAGANPELSTLYGLRETPSHGYPQRTRWNVRDATATLIVGVDSPGTRLTRSACAHFKRPLLGLAWERGRAPFGPFEIDAIRTWLVRYNVEVLNVAGNRERSNPGIEIAVHELLCQTLGGL